MNVKKAVSGGGSGGRRAAQRLAAFNDALDVQPCGLLHVEPLIVRVLDG